MAPSSGFSSAAAPPPGSATERGSRAMPQIGQLPGRSRTISGCIGQVHSATGTVGAGRRSREAEAADGGEAQPAAAEAEAAGAGEAGPAAAAEAGPAAADEATAGAAAVAADEAPAVAEAGSWCACSRAMYRSGSRRKRSRHEALQKE